RHRRGRTRPLRVGAALLQGDPHRRVQRLRHGGGRRPPPARHRPLPRPRPAGPRRRLEDAHPHLPPRAVARRVLHPRPPGRDRRRVMWQVDIGRAVAMLGLATAIVFDATSIPLLVVVAFVLGTGETLFDNAAQSLMPSVAPRDRLEEANSRLYAVQITYQEFV